MWKGRELLAIWLELGGASPGQALPGPAPHLPGHGEGSLVNLFQLTPVISESRPLLSLAVNSVQGLCLL